MICILSPNITLENIQYPDMREVLQNITYLRWPPKNVSPEKFKFFWRKLHNNIVKHDTERYPKISVVSANRNVPV